MTEVRALAGKIVLVTRPREQAAELSDRLRKRGAIALEAPAIRIEQAEPGGLLDRAVRETAEGAYEWVVFTSAAGVEAWADRSEALGVPPLRVDVAAVGAGTAEALRRRGMTAALVPETFTTESLGAEFPNGSGRVLLARADIAPADLDETLAAKGWEPVRVDAYRNRPAETLPEEVRRALEEGRVDAITFTSASTVDGFVRLAGAVDEPVVVCIGPVTAEAARGAGFTVHAVARPHTIDGLIAALERILA